MRLLLLLCAIVLGGNRASAADGEHEAARSHFVAGQTAYERGRFREAAEHFAAAYAIEPLAELLFNEAQAWRGDFDLTGKRDSARHAIELFRRCIASDKLGEADRREAADRLAVLTTEVIDREAPRPPGDRRRGRTGLWIGVGVGAAVVVLGVSLGLGIGLTRSNASSASPSLVARW